MYAVIAIHTKNEITREAFTSQQPANNLEESIKKTRFFDSPELFGRIVYHDVGLGGVCLVFANGIKGIQVHVENYVDSWCVSELKGNVSALIVKIKDIVEKSGNKVDSVRISLLADDNVIQEGQESKLWDYAKKQFSDKILSQFLVAIVSPIVAVLVAGARVEPDAAPGQAASVDPGEIALWTFLGVLVALILRTIIELFQFKKGVDYVER